MRTPVIRLLLIGGPILIVVFAAGFVAGHLTYKPVNQWRWQRYVQRLDGRFLDKPAPEIEMKTLEGNIWRLSENKGRVVILYFWASWCEPCKEETPHLKELQAKYGGRDDFALVGISLDEDPADTLREVQRSEMSWTQLHEPGAGWDAPAAQAFEVTRIPSMWLIDKKGQVAALRLQGSKTRNAVERALGLKDEATETG